MRLAPHPDVPVGARAAHRADERVPRRHRRAPPRRARVYGEAARRFRDLHRERVARVPARDVGDHVLRRDRRARRDELRLGHPDHRARFREQVASRKSPRHDLRGGGGVVQRHHRRRRLPQGAHQDLHRTAAQRAEIRALVPVLGLHDAVHHHATLVRRGADTHRRLHRVASGVHHALGHDVLPPDGGQTRRQAAHGVRLGGAQRPQVLLPDRLLLLRGAARRGARERRGAPRRGETRAQRWEAHFRKRSRPRRERPRGAAVHRQESVVSSAGRERRRFAQKKQPIHARRGDGPLDEARDAQASAVLRPVFRLEPRGHVS
mmetsp:Transcript_6456/g.27523  ORF Transcript_6456/g.27523 Transcript_6456/m.27523 type:complete len:320 (+) Transcript_6456:2469-3428(+)